MRCPKCDEEYRFNSDVWKGIRSSTCAPATRFKDIDGRLHNHDPNIVLVEYLCSNGHKFLKKVKTPCNSCNYGKDNDAALYI